MGVSIEITKKGLKRLHRIEGDTDDSKGRPDKKLSPEGPGDKQFQVSL